MIQLTDEQERWMEAVRQMKEQTHREGEPLRFALDIMREGELIAHCLLPEDDEMRLDFIYRAGRAFGAHELRLFLDVWTAEPGAVDPNKPFAEQPQSTHALLTYIATDDGADVIGAMLHYHIGDDGQVSWGSTGWAVPPTDPHAEALADALEPFIEMEEALATALDEFQLTEVEAKTHFNCAVVKAILPIYEGQAGIMLAPKTEYEKALIVRSMEDMQGMEVHDLDD